VGGASRGGRDSRCVLQPRGRPGRAGLRRREHVVAPGGDVIARAAMFSEELLRAESGGGVRRRACGADPAIERGDLPGARHGTRDYVEKNRFARGDHRLSGGIIPPLWRRWRREGLGPSRVLGVTCRPPSTSPGRAWRTRTRWRRISASGASTSRSATHSPPPGARSRAVRGSGGGHDGGKISQAPHPRDDPMALFQQVRGDRADHRKQERDERRVRDALRRHGRRLRGHQGRLQDDGCTVCRAGYNESRGRDVIPARVLTKPPSAELRPDQKDSDSLPEYDLLDPILKMYVEEDKKRPGDGGGGVSGRCRAQGRDAGGPERVQATPGPPRRQDHPPRPGEGPPDADHQRVERIGGDSGRTLRVAVK